MKPSSLGDIVHTLPAVSALKRHWPSAKIRWLVNTEWAPLLHGHPQLEEVLLFPRRDLAGLRGLTRIGPWAQALRARAKADLVLDFQGLLRSALISKLCCGKNGRIVGLSDAREGARHFHHESVDVSGCRHAVDRYLALVRTIGVPIPASLDWPLPAGTPPVAFSEHAPFVVLHPFSRGKGKSLSVADVTAFCEALAPMRVVLAGRSDALIPPLANVTNLLNGTTIPELIWTLRRARFVVSVDSGPMHIASALGVPLVAIHTWSDPGKVGPYDARAWIWKEAGIFKMKSPDQRETMPDVRALARFVADQSA